jgi:hypothetical protein
VSQPILETDYDIDIATVMHALGINPNLVVPDTAHIRLVDNKIILEYTCRRAVPPRIMGMALLTGAPHQPAPPQAAEEEPNGRD